VRRALTQLIDREGISRALYGGLARPANGPLAPGLWPYDRTVEPVRFDPAASGAALDEAGFRRGRDGIREKGGVRFSFSLSLGGGSDIQRQIAETVQQAFRVAGIEMTLRPMEWATFSSAVDEGDFEACFLAMNLDPNPDLFPNWHSSQVPPNGWNSVYYRNPRVDALIEKLRDTFDQQSARPLYSEIQRLIRDDEPVTFLHFVPVKWGLSRRVRGAATSPIGLSLFWPGAASWRTVRSKSPA
jgi:peptide/nickel transport system substrate-binding protein